MTRLVVAAFAVLALSSSAHAQTKTKRPNIIVVITDDKDGTDEASQWDC